MAFFENVLRIMDVQMETPEPYDWFHLLWLGITVLATVLLCLWHKKSGNEHRVRVIVFVTAVIVALMEVYKMVNYSFSYENGIVYDFQWYAFPWQFCSTPMYVGLLTGIFRKGRIHESLQAYLATYSIFAGICVMLYPVTVFIGTVGINIQTMFCHGSMITIGAFLLYSGYVKFEHKTIMKAIPVFVVAVVMAIAMNEIAYISGLLETETFNMFFISPHCEPSLPVYSIVQELVPYPWCLIIYILAFSVAAYLMLLIAMGIRSLFQKKAKAITV